MVVHRELKPANILVTAAGEVQLLDFGIAPLLEGERTPLSPLTRQVGQMLTPDYASPEQLRGEPVGTASELYSLAVVTYEVLMDQKHYRLKRSTAGALEEAILAVDVPPASSIATDPAARGALRGDLDAILNKALEKDARERYAGVEAFAQDIERHLAQCPSWRGPTARPIACDASSPTIRSRPWHDRLTERACNGVHQTDNARHGQGSPKPAEPEPNK